MKDMIIAVGEVTGRWMYVVRSDETHVYGPVWGPIANRWSPTIRWYPITSIGKKQPPHPRPVGVPPRTTDHDRRHDPRL